MTVLGLNFTSSLQIQSFFSKVRQVYGGGGVGWGAGVGRGVAVMGKKDAEMVLKGIAIIQPTYFLSFKASVPVMASLQG